jgi:hypothetical protein
MATVQKAVFLRAFSGGLSAASATSAVKPFGGGYCRSVNLGALCGSVVNHPAEKALGHC